MSLWDDTEVLIESPSTIRSGTNQSSVATKVCEIQAVGGTKINGQAEVVWMFRRSSLHLLLLLLSHSPRLPYCEVWSWSPSVDEPTNDSVASHNIQ